MVFRRSKQSSPVPTWASPLTAAEFAKFQSAIRSELREFDVEIGDGFFTVSGRHKHFGLANLAQQWASTPESQRDGVVRDHFRRALEAADTPRPEGSDLIRVLRPRLWGSETMEAVTSPLLVRRVADDLFGVLCLDLPNAVVNLTPEEAESTGLSIDELWDAAAAQIDDGIEVRDDHLPNGTRAVVGDSFFVTSRLLDLDRFVGPLPKEGAVVAVPHRSVLLTRAITSFDAAVQTINHLAIVTPKYYREGPGSISPSVYWWRRSRPLMRIPSTATGDSATVSPPAELVEVLKTFLPGTS